MKLAYWTVISRVIEEDAMGNLWVTEVWRHITGERQRLRYPLDAIGGED